MIDGLTKVVMNNLINGKRKKKSLVMDIEGADLQKPACLGRPWSASKDSRAAFK